MAGAIKGPVPVAQPAQQLQRALLQMGQVGRGGSDRAQGLGMVFQHFLHIGQHVAQPFVHVLGVGSLKFVQPQTQHAGRQGQPQPAGHLLQLTVHPGPVGQTRGVLVAGSQALAPQIQQLAGGDGVAEELGGDVGQLVGLIEDEDVGLGQEVADGVVLE